MTEIIRLLFGGQLNDARNQGDIHNKGRFKRYNTLTNNEQVKQSEERSNELTYQSPQYFSPIIPTPFVIRFAHRSLAPRFTSVVPDIRKKFDRSIGIDTVNRLQIVERMRNLEVNNSETFEERFEAKPGIKVSGRDNTFMHIQKGASGKGEGRTTVSVRAGLEEAAAFFWDFTSRVNLSLSGDIQRTLEEEKRGEWEILTKKRRKLGPKHGSSHNDREYLNIMNLVKTDENTIIIQSKPRTSESELPRTTTKGVHKAEETTTMKFKKRGEKEVKIEFISKLSLGKLVSKEATKSTLMASLDHIKHSRFYLTICCQAQWLLPRTVKLWARP